MKRSFVDQLSSCLAPGLLLALLMTYDSGFVQCSLDEATSELESRMDSENIDRIFTLAACVQNNYMYQLSQGRTVDYNQIGDDNLVLILTFVNIFVETVVTPCAQIIGPLNELWQRIIHSSNDNRLLAFRSRPKYKIADMVCRKTLSVLETKDPESLAYAAFLSRYQADHSYQRDNPDNFSSKIPLMVYLTTGTDGSSLVPLGNTIRYRTPDRALVHSVVHVDSLILSIAEIVGTQIHRMDHSMENFSKKFIEIIRKPCEHVNRLLPSWWEDAHRFPQNEDDLKWLQAVKACDAVISAQSDVLNQAFAKFTSIDKSDWQPF